MKVYVATEEEVLVLTPLYSAAQTRDDERRGMLEGMHDIGALWIWYEDELGNADYDFTAKFSKPPSREKLLEWFKARRAALFCGNN